MNKECPKKTFTLVDPQRELGAQVTKDVKVEALQRLFHLRGSLRHTADFLYENGKKVSHDVLLRWVQQEAKEAIRWYTIFEPRCSGTIVVDEKWVKLHKEWHYVYMAVDPVSHDLLHIRVFLNNGTDSAKTFLAELRSFGFQPTTVVTDSLGGYPAAIKAIYPKAVHIECLIHAERAARKVLRDVAKELEKTHEEAFDLLKGHLHEAFSSGSRAELDHHWDNLEHCLQDPALQPLIEPLAKYYPLVLRVVEQSKNTTRSSNAVERVILEFDRKYDPMQAFSSFGSMQCWCELFQLYYRMRPFKRGKHKGRSPAQVMGYPVENLTWVDLVLGVVPSRSGPHVA